MSRKCVNRKSNLEWDLYTMVDTTHIRFTGRGSPCGRAQGRPGRERSSPCSSPSPAGRNGCGRKSRPHQDVERRIVVGVRPEPAGSARGTPPATVGLTWRCARNGCRLAMYRPDPRTPPGRPCTRACAPAVPSPTPGWHRLSPAFCFTFRPGFSTVPFALLVMPFVFRSSRTTVWAVSATLRLIW